MGDLVAQAVEPFASLMRHDGVFFWPYLLSFAVIAVAVYLFRRSGQLPITVRAIFIFLFPPAIYRHQSARLDFRYFIVNTFLYTLLVVPITLTSAGVARLALPGMVQLFGVPEFPLASGPLAAILAAALLIVASDLGFFVAHYLQHKVPVLWAFHQVHHAAEVLHPITSFRSHPVDTFLDFTLMGAMTGLATAVLAYCFDANLTPATILGTNALAFAFHLAGSHLRHSHIWLCYGPRLSKIIVSPAMHQVHHSCDTAHKDKNLGGMFAIWDNVMGTLYVPQGRETLTLGLGSDEREPFRTVLDLYFRPFRRLADLVVEGRPSLSKTSST